MNKFVHRILSRRTRSAVPAEDLFRDALGRRVVWLGEFHSEPRILALQNELAVRTARRLGARSAAPAAGAAAGAAAAAAAEAGPAGDGDGDGDGDEDGDDTDPRPRLHVVTEHFSLEMGGLLRRFQSDPSFGGVPELEKEYRRTGAEGHALGPYRGFLRFCRRTTLRRRRGGAAPDDDDDDDGGGSGGDVPLQDEAFSSSAEASSSSVDGCCEVHLHGGFIPRRYAARWNKCGSDLDERRALLDEIVAEDWLPGPERGPAMRRALFGETEEERDVLLLRGGPGHYWLVESLLSGRDPYAPADDEPADERIDRSADTPLGRLYQAQLLKDHAMGYFLAKLMLDHASAPARRNDRYLVLAGYGHVKHRLGVPACLEGYLRAECLHHPDGGRRGAALDVLTNLISESGSGEGPKGQLFVGSQMLYETYLEETYEPLRKAEEMEDEEEQEAAKRAALRELYTTKLETMDELILGSEIVRGPLLNPSAGIGAFEWPCADYLFVYDEDDGNVLPPTGDGDAAATAAAAATAKAETREAYDRVGRTAGRRGNIAKARAVMLRLGYTERDLEVVGEDDLCNFQGVANPHAAAGIQKGERVLDVGSGLGVDSFLAARACGADGAEAEGAAMVAGVDLAPGEAAHARRRAAERGCHPGRVMFLAGDAERLDEALPEDCRGGGGDGDGGAGFFDVCISNGAFCLVPDKRRAFEQVYGALKPGGRMAVSTTTVRARRSLDPNFEWPVCMRMFANLDDIVPMCEDVGFKNVRIVDAESPLEGIELPEEALAEEERMRSDGERQFKIHGKYEDHFKHLENIDMDELCKVVTVYGEK